MQIVGEREAAGGTCRASFWDSGGVTVDLGTLGGENSWAYAINADGEIAGAAETRDGLLHAVLWRGGRMTDVGRLLGQDERRMNTMAIAMTDVSLPAFVTQNKARKRSNVWRG